MTSILVVKEINSCNQFKCNYLKNQKIFLHILMRFSNLNNIFSILQNNEPRNLNISDNIDSENVVT